MQVVCDAPSNALGRLHDHLLISRNTINDLADSLAKRGRNPAEVS